MVDVTVSEGMYRLVNMKSSRKGEVLSVSTINKIVSNALDKDKPITSASASASAHPHRWLQIHVHALCLKLFCFILCFTLLCVCLCMCVSVIYRCDLTCTDLSLALIP